MIVKVVEDVEMFWIASQRRKCEEMSTISRMGVLVLVQRNLVLLRCYRKACISMSLHEDDVRIFG